MNDIVPSGSHGAAALLSPLRDSTGGPMLKRVSAFVAQPPVRKALPWFAGIAGLGLLALTWSTLSPPPQRVLYASLGDAERADVVGALDKAAIEYSIDNATGALTVAEDDLYRARMVVASDGVLAAPETGAEMIDALPMGASRTLEGDRLRAAQERDLMLTIKEIDGVEAVRVHLAQAERSVFVRDKVAPTASVMLRMVRGRTLGPEQVLAIANLVAGSVPGLSPDAVRIVDQHGQLLTQTDAGRSDRLDLQSRTEAKLRAQVDQLLSPIIGVGNFSTEIQVDLDMDEVTSARESYDRNGAVRRESMQRSTSPGSEAAVGIPGALSNTPPAPAQPGERAPVGGPPAGAAAPAQGESSTSRTYELGREVAVSNIAPGGVRRLSVAVALNQEALKKMSQGELKKFENLISAAVGANPQRGDVVTVVVRPFEPEEMADMPFWEAGWFAMLIRNGVALIAVLMILLFAVRPIVRSLTSKKDSTAENGSPLTFNPPSLRAGAQVPAAADRENLSSQIELAQRMVREQPGDALEALRRMLGEHNEIQGAGR